MGFSSLYIVTPFVTLANVAVPVTKEMLTSYAMCENESCFAETHIKNVETVFVEEQIIRNEVATVVTSDHSWATSRGTATNYFFPYETE